MGNPLCQLVGGLMFDCWIGATGAVHVHGLRCVCARLPVALGPAEVYSSVDADTVLAVLTHKITKAVRTQVGMGCSRPGRPLGRDSGCGLLRPARFQRRAGKT